MTSFKKWFGNKKGLLVWTNKLCWLCTLYVSWARSSEGVAQLLYNKASLQTVQLPWSWKSSHGDSVWDILRKVLQNRWVENSAISHRRFSYGCHLQKVQMYVIKAMSGTILTIYDGVCTYIWSLLQQRTLTVMYTYIQMLPVSGSS